MSVFTFAITTKGDVKIEKAPALALARQNGKCRGSPMIRLHAIFATRATADVPVRGPLPCRRPRVPRLERDRRFRYLQQGPFPFLVGKGAGGLVC